MKSALIIGCVLLGAAWSAPAQAASKPITACDAMSAAQASVILGRTVYTTQPSHQGTARHRTTSCAYLTFPPAGSPVAASSPTFNLDLGHGSATRRAFTRILEIAEDPRGNVVPLNGLPPGVSSQELKPHLITIDGLRGFYTLAPQSKEFPTSSGYLTVLKDGYVVRVNVESAPDPIATATRVMRDVLPRL
jgi:hypothetical protein